MQLIINKVMTPSIIWIKSHCWLLIILFISLLMRLMFISLFTHWDEGYMMDSSRYLRVAMNILYGRGFTEWSYPSAFSPPLYPIFMSIVIRIFGLNTIIIKILQVLLSMLSSIWIYLIGKAIFNRRIGLIGAFAVAVNPDIVVMSGSLYTETLYIFLSCLTFVFLVYTIRFPKKTWVWWLTGVLMGLSILTRHIMILYPVLLLGFVLMFPSLRYLRKPLIYISLVCYLLLLPWTVRNYVVFDQFVPVASGAGGGLWHGSDAAYDGRFQYELSKRTVSQETEGLDRPIEKDRVLLQKSLRTIAKSPTVFLEMSIKKFLRFFTQVYEDVPEGDERHSNPAILMILTLSYYPVLALCIFGGIVSIRRWRTLFPLYWIIIYSGMIYSIMLVIPRYRIPLLPFMILFACVGLDYFIKHFYFRRNQDVNA